MGYLPALIIKTMNAELLYLKTYFPNLYDLAIELGKTTTRSAKELAPEIKVLIDYGFSEKQIKEMTPIIINLSCRYVVSMGMVIHKFIY